MTNPNSQPDFNDSNSVRTFFDTHPDVSPQYSRSIEFHADVEEYAMQLAIQEAAVFAHLKQYLPGMEELHELVLSKEDGIPTVPDLIATLVICRKAVANDEQLTDMERIEIIDKLDYTVEITSIIGDIAAKLLYPEIEPTIADIKQYIDNNECLSDNEKAILSHTCDVLLTHE